MKSRATIEELEARIAALEAVIALILDELRRISPKP